MNVNQTPVLTKEEQLKYKIVYEYLANAAISAWEASLRSKLDEPTKEEITRIELKLTSRSDIDAALALSPIKQSETYKEIAAFLKKTEDLLRYRSFEKVNAMSIDQIKNIFVRNLELDALFAELDDRDDNSTLSSSNSDSSTDSGSGSDDDLDCGDSPNAPTIRRTVAQHNLRKLAEEQSSDNSSDESNSSETEDGSVPAKKMGFQRPVSSTLTLPKATTRTRSPFFASRVIAGALPSITEEDEPKPATSSNTSAHRYHK